MFFDFSFPRPHLLGTSLRYSLFACVLLGLWGTSGAVQAAPRDIQKEAQAQHDAAVSLARADRLEPALALLRPLHKQFPNDLGITRDLLLVTEWAGHDADAVVIYESMPKVEQPDFVLEAIARAYRHLSWPVEATAIYRQGLVQSPLNLTFIVGDIRSTAEANDPEGALARAEKDLNLHGDRVEVLLAAAFASTLAKKPTDTVRYSARALHVDPANREATRDLILALQATDVPDEALRLADLNPDLLSPDEYRLLQGDYAALLVRRGATSIAPEAQRFAGTDRAIAEEDRLIDLWTRNGRPAKEISRLRFDRILALRDRVRMKEVIVAYEEVHQETSSLPVYVIQAAGDAYLYLRAPEKSRDAYLQVIAEEPHNFNVRLQLFYAYLDLNDYAKAFNVIDTLERDTRSEGGSLHDTAARTAGFARLYAGMTGDGEKRLRPLLNAAPKTPTTYALVGNLDQAHGWPRAAKAEYERGLALAGGPNRDNEVGIATSDLALQNFDAADAHIQDLTQRFPENLGVQRLARSADIRKMAEFQLMGGYAAPLDVNTTNPVSAENLEARLYSPVIRENWRVYADTYFAHQDEPNHEGSIALSRNALGAEYRDGPWTVQAAPTYSLWGGAERVGIEGDVTRSLTDQWTVALGGESLSRATPLRAMNKGVTADFIGAHMTWREDDERSLRFGGGLMPFSDGNQRLDMDADFLQRLYADPDWRVEGMAALGYEQNSKNENRFYYNPSSDILALAGGRITHTLYQRYETLWQHNLQLMPGVNWEQSKGSAPALQARYEHRLFWDNTLDAGVNVRFLHRAYDGAAENDIEAGFDVRRHFGP